MNLKVLWVDDEPDTLRYESRLAAEHGWLVTWQTNVDGALDRLKRETFDLVVVDVILPKNTFEEERKYVDPEAGLGLIKAIRERAVEAGTDPNVPILVFTAYSQADQVTQSLGDVTCLRKPVDEKEFVVVLNDLSRAHSKISSQSGIRKKPGKCA